MQCGVWSCDVSSDKKCESACIWMPNIIEAARTALQARLMLGSEHQEVFVLLYVCSMWSFISCSILFKSTALGRKLHHMVQFYQHREVYTSNQLRNEFHSAIMFCEILYGFMSLATFFMDHRIMGITPALSLCFMNIYWAIMYDRILYQIISWRCWHVSMPVTTANAVYV